MVFPGSEKRAAAKELCLHQLMKRKPAISLWHSPISAGSRATWTHSTGAWKQQLDTTRDQGWGAHGDSGLARGGTCVRSRGLKGPCRQPAEMAAATSHAAWRLLAAAGGEADVLQLCLIKWQKNPLKSRRQTASSGELPRTRLLRPSMGPWGWGTGRQQMPGAHLNMGKAFWAEMLLFAAAEHTGRSNAPSRDLPAATPEL